MENSYVILREWVCRISDAVWGIPLIFAILIVGGIISVKSGFVQFKRLALAFKLLLKGEKSTAGITAFESLATSLAAMIGTGNIVGVATAVAAGGPGAIMWMLIASLLGMATTYAEGFLAVKYRSIDKRGRILGGAFMYIEKGVGSTFLAKLFAFLCATAAVLGIGTLTQVNGIARAFTELTSPNGEPILNWMGIHVPAMKLVCAVVVTFLAARVILGGVERIARVSAKIVPLMGGMYVLATVAVLISCADAVPEAVGEIISCAFTGRAAAGGISGALVARAMRMGVARGIFSNEAGMGSASIAAAASDVTQPVEQGLVSMIGTFIDTTVLCTMTGLAIVASGAVDTGLDGVALTNLAYSAGFPFAPWLGRVIVSVSLMLFAFASVVGWNYYGEQCMEYLAGRRSLSFYRLAYLAAVFVGCFMEMELVWSAADILNGLMAIPNLTALIVLSPIVADGTRRYFAK